MLCQLFAEKKRQYKIKDAKKKTQALTTSTCFGMPKESALDICGLTNLGERYGVVSDNVALIENDDEFKDWHLQVMCGSECFKI